jgi:outer membrane murein-binding lipoprotein Lpp
MATVFDKHVTLNHLLTNWKSNDGPTDQEIIAYANAASEQLKDPSMKGKFEENVKQVGTWANEIDANFDIVTRKFKDMKDEFGQDFPDFPKYYDEWLVFKARWVALLQDSRDVASQTVATLKRFDKIFIEMVLQIKTPEDREEVIVELQSFIDEDHSESVRLSQGFLNLKRDIEDFVTRLDQFIAQTGAQLAQRAKELKAEIETLEGEITVLDGQIKATETALIVTGALTSLLGVIIAGSILAAYQSQRADKVKTLNQKRAELADVNRKQEALAHLQSEFDGTKPTIALICERLVLFGEIWTSVRSQAIQFQEMLKKGMNAQTNMRFKAEITLARDECQPLQNGLERYAVELENRSG